MHDSVLAKIIPQTYAVGH